MGKTYIDVIEDYRDTIRELAEEHHRHLLAPQIHSDVQIECIAVFAPRDEDGLVADGPAITVHGAPAIARIRITRLEERVAGRGDAVIWIDGDQFPLLPERTQRAVLDHELEHLEVKIGDDGQVKMDDIARPLLRIKPHDFQVGWFSSVAKRHGRHSFEVHQAQTLMTASQLWFPDFAVAEAGEGQEKRSKKAEAVV